MFKYMQPCDKENTIFKIIYKINFPALQKLYINMRDKYN